MYGTRAVCRNGQHAFVIRTSKVQMSVWEVFILRDFRRISKLRKAIASPYLSVCLSVRMEQLGSLRTDFHNI
jgi:hypothetical protein